VLQAWRSVGLTIRWSPRKTLLTEFHRDTSRLVQTRTHVSPHAEQSTKQSMGSDQGARGPDSPCGRPYQATAGRPPLSGARVFRSGRPPRGPGLHAPPMASPHPVCRVITSSHSRTPILGTFTRQHTGPSLYGRGNVAAYWAAKNTHIYGRESTQLFVVPKSFESRLPTLN
jgi:hypothetical protein